MTIADILGKELAGIVERIKKNAAAKKKTGQLSDSPRYEVIEDQGRTIGYIYAAAYFKTLETGRKPTPGKKPSREMLENIAKWADVSGLDDDAVWPIAVSIQERGTKLWRDGGNKDVFTPETNEESMKDLKSKIIKAEANKVANELRVLWRSR